MSLLRLQSRYNCSIYTIKFNSSYVIFVHATKLRYMLIETMASNRETVEAAS